MDIEGGIRGNVEEVKKKSQAPVTSRILGELIDLHPHMVVGDPGAPERVIYEQVIGLGGERHVPLEVIFPPVTVADKTQLEKLGLTRWRIDLTCYTAQDFATGELNRSKGHVNSEREVEVFQTISGRIRMLLQNPKDLSKAWYVDAWLGECVLIPPGWYHSTHVLAGPSDVINFVNREGFEDWSEKGYGQFQAAYTFARSVTGEIVPVINPAYSRTPVLIALRPTQLPLLQNFSGSILNLVHQAPPQLLEELADDILSANPNSRLILPQQTTEGDVIQDYYQPVYTEFDNLIHGDELCALELEVPAVDNELTTYLDALRDFLRLSKKEQELLIVLPEQLGSRLAKESIREWIALRQRERISQVVNIPGLGHDVLWQRGYKILKSFETGGLGSQTFLAIDPSGRLSAVKYSDQEGVDGNGISWLRKQVARTEEYRSYLGEHIPFVFEYAEIEAQGNQSPGFFYAMEYRPFETLSDYLLYNSTANEQGFFRRLNIALEQQVEMLYDKPDTWVAADQQGEKSCLEIFYIDRFRRRLTMLADPNADLNPAWSEGGRPVNRVASMFKQLMSADTLTINGVTYPNLPRLLELIQIHREQIDKFGPERLSLAHGDFHSGNMGFELGKPIEQGFVQFDLRGVDLGVRMDVVYDLGKLAFSFLFNLADRAHALIAPISSLQIEEKTREVNVRLESDASQEKRILSHLEIRRKFWDFLKHHLPLVDVLRKMGEEPETWLTRTALAEAVNLIGVAPDRLKDDPSGSLSLTYYVLTTKLLDDFLRSSGIGIQTGRLPAPNWELL